MNNLNMGYDTFEITCTVFVLVYGAQDSSILLLVIITRSDYFRPGGRWTIHYGTLRVMIIVTDTVVLCECCTPHVSPFVWQCEMVV